MPAIPTTPWRSRKAPREDCERQLLASAGASRTTSPLAKTPRLSSSSGLTPVFPTCGWVRATIWRQYDGSVRISWYPVIAVLNTTSPVAMPSAPMERPRNRLPSSSASRASRFIQAPPAQNGKRRRVRYPFRSCTPEFFTNIRNGNASPARLCQFRRIRRESAVYHLEAPVSQESCYGNEIPVGRNQHRHIIIAVPCQTDQVGCDARVYPLLLGASHITTAFRNRTITHLFVARGTLGAFPLALPRQHETGDPRESADRIFHPSPQTAIFPITGVIRAVNVHSLIGDQCFRINDTSSLTSQARA